MAGRGVLLKPGKIITHKSDLKSVLERSTTVAVLGLSPKPERDSHKVALYLKKNGYRIIPVRPAQKFLLGERAYSSLEDIHTTVDIIDVFRSPEQVMAHAREALRLKPKVFWMQLNIENHDAALLLTAQGIDVVMNRCIKTEHEKLIKKDHAIETGAKKRENVIVVKKRSVFAGTAGVGFPSARTAWRKTSGECPAMALHGIARIVGDRTDLAINKKAIRP